VNIAWTAGIMIAIVLVVMGTVWVLGGIVGRDKK
jgi:hypothetical protein